MFTPKGTPIDEKKADEEPTEEEPRVPTPVVNNELTLTVLKSRDLPCLRYLNDDSGEDFLPFTQLSLNLQGNSAQSEVVEGGEVEYNTTAVMPMDATDPKILDWFCSASIPITVTEYSTATPGEEEEEKLSVYEASLDISSLLHARITEIEGWCPLVRKSPNDLEEIFLGPKAEGDETSERHTKMGNELRREPALLVKATLAKELLTQQELDDSMVVTVSIGSLKGVPTHWLGDYEVLSAAEEIKLADDKAARVAGFGTVNKKAGGGGKKGGKDTAKKSAPKGKGKGSDYDKLPKHTFCVAYELPLSSGEDVLSVQGAHNKMRLPSAEDFPPDYPEGCQEELDTTRTTTSGSESNRKSAKKAPAVDKKLQAEMEAKRLQREEAEMAAMALRKKSRTVDWNFERKCFFTASAVGAFKHKIKQAERFYFKVSRALVGEGGDLTHEGAGQTGVVLRHLLKEGMTEVDGEYPIRMTREQVQFILDERERIKTEAEAEGGKKSAKNKKDEEEEEENPDVFELTNSIATIKVTLSRPLVPRSTVPKLQPHDLIPSRMPPARVPPSPSQEFQEEVRGMIEFLAREFCYAADSVGWAKEQARQRKKEMTYNINTGGSYRLLKEKLKPSIVKILREHLTKVAEEKGETVDFSQPLPADVFSGVITQLYSQLVDKVHLTLNKTIRDKSDNKTVIRQSPLPVLPDLKRMDIGTFTPKQLLVLAGEKELAGEYSACSSYHQRRVALPDDSQPEDDKKWRPDDSAVHWNDYALFWLRVGNQQEAISCLKESISIDPKHTRSLLAYLAIVLDKVDLDSAEVFARALREQHPGCWLVVVLEALFLDLADEKALCEESYHVAQGIFETFVLEGADIKGDPVLSSVFDTPKMEQGPLLVQAARFLLSVNCSDIATFALKRAIENDGPNKWHSLQCAQAFRFQGDANKAVEAAKACIAKGRNDGEVIEAFSVMGHTLWEANDHDGAVKAYEVYLEWEPESPDALLLTRLGGHYKAAREWGKAESIYLELCKCSPCASAWLGVGTALLETNQFEGARQALEEANNVDNTNAGVWGALCLLHLSTSHISESRRCFDFACGLALDDADLLRKIGIGYLEKGFLSLAQKAFTRSLELEKAVSTLILLGDVFGAQNCVTDLLNYYQQAFEMVGANGDSKLRVETAKRIVTALVSLGRNEEARKYLESTDLGNPAA